MKVIRNGFRHIYLVFLSVIYLYLVVPVHLKKEKARQDNCIACHYFQGQMDSLLFIIPLNCPDAFLLFLLLF